jgi:hypothetical protein
VKPILGIDFGKVLGWLTRSAPYPTTRRLGIEELVLVVCILIVVVAVIGMGQLARYDHAHYVRVTLRGNLGNVVQTELVRLSDFQPYGRGHGCQITMPSGETINWAGSYTVEPVK